MMKGQKFIHLFFLFTIFLVMSACVPKATEKKAVCGTNQAFNSITRSCQSAVAPNKAAVAANITPASFSEDVQSIITLSYTDFDLDLATQCQLTNLTNVTITQACSCTVGGVCTVGVTGTSNYTGAAQFSYSVKTNNMPSNTATATLTINAVNDTPTISAIAAQSTNEDVTKAISFTIADVDNTLTCAGSVSVTANSNAVLVPTVVITGTAPNCVATITPAANLFGSSNITLQVTDGTLTASSAFTLTVNSVNDSPVISPFLVAQTTNEDTAKVVNFTLSDVESTLDCTAVYLSASSSNVLLVPSINVVFSGVYPNCVATITPLADQFGTTNITFTASDGSASSSSNAFTLTVTAVNDAPVISAIAAQTTNEDVALAIPFTISDVDNTLTCASSVSVTTNSNPTVASSIAFTGTAPNCTATITPAADQSGAGINIILTVTDGTLTSTAGFSLTVTAVDDPPTFTTSMIMADTNEGGMVVAGPLKIDEDAGSTTDEDAQSIQISSIVSDNASVLPSASSPRSTSSIRIFYDLNDNGVEDSGEERDLNVDLETVGTDDAHAHNFYLKLYPVAGISGNANLTLTTTDGLTPITTTFSLIVHPVAALHGGWSNIKAVGIKTDKTGAPAADADVQCNYNKSTDTKACNANQNCTGTASPTATIIPDAANVIYWDSSNKKCYRSTGTTIFSWVDFKTTCPLVRNALCTGGNCISAAPSVPTTVGEYYYNTSSGCYISTGTSLVTDWISYVPSKVTLSWNAFTVTGSGADSAVTVYGWNVYRREAGYDYDFKSGFLKTTSTDTMTISSASTRTFTDTTAVAGKVYYYLVRPVDSTTRHLTISTPEVFSEVRVLAPTANYAFVHRWMANQEICNSMHMTTSTTNKVDPTKNYRCPFTGPGDDNGCNYTKIATACDGSSCIGSALPAALSGGSPLNALFYNTSDSTCYKNTVDGGATWVAQAATHYYDIGKDMLVDISEAGCPYTAAPACTSNGCIGIGSPTSLGLSASTNNIYYDRSSGACYINIDNSTGWNSYNVATAPQILAASAKVNTALNPPLTNLSQAQSSLVCSNRSIATPTANLTSMGTTTPLLPSKKEFIAYSSAPVGVLDTVITAMEEGFSLNVQSRCNSSSANGLETAYSDSNIPSTSFIYSVPGTSSSGIRSLYTGSVPWVSNYSTETCSSRYGIQDVYGNVAEWVKDSMTCNESPSVITTDMTIGATTAAVASITKFPSTGSLLIGTEEIDYTGKTTTSFTGLTRAANASVAAAHLSGVNVDLMTRVSVAVLAGDTTITVTSTSGFPTSGSLLIESEYVTYTGVTATTFTGVTRGVGGTVDAGHAMNIRVVSQAVLTGAATIADTSLTLSSTTSLPTSGTIIVDTEEITYTGKTATTITGLTRGSNSTVAAIHNIGAAIVASTSNDYVCSSVAGTDLGDFDFGDGVKYGFDLVTGPFNDASGNSYASEGDGFLTNWDFRDELFGAGKFNFPLGMPMYVDIASSPVSASAAIPFLLDVGPTAGITSTQLHEDGIIVNGADVNDTSANPSKTGSFAQGGSYLSGNRSGRYSSELIPDATVGPDVGLRCYIPIDPLNFPADPERHTYSY